MKIQATYDGTALQLDEPLELPLNARVTGEVYPELDTQEQPEEPVGKKMSFLKTAMSLNVDCPEDSSHTVEEYLYGNLGETGHDVQRQVSSMP